MLHISKYMSSVVNRFCCASHNNFTFINPRDSLAQNYWYDNLPMTIFLHLSLRWGRPFPINFRKHERKRIYWLGQFDLATDIFFGKQGYKLSQIGNTFKKISCYCKDQDLIKRARSLLAKIICFNKILIQACSKIPFRKNSCRIKTSGLICIVNR